MAVSLRIWGNAKSPGPDASPGTPHAVPPGPRTFLSVISRACWKPSSAPNTPLKSGSWSQSGRFDTNSVTVPPGPVAAIPPRSGTRGGPRPGASPPPTPPRGPPRPTLAANLAAAASPPKNLVRGPAEGAETQIWIYTDVDAALQSCRAAGGPPSPSPSLEEVKPPLPLPS